MYLFRKWFLDAHSLPADKESPFRLRNIGVGEVVMLQEMTALLGTGNSKINSCGTELPGAWP